MLGQAGIWADLTRSSFRVRCTAWRPICTRFSSPHLARVQADPALAVAEAVGVGSRAADLAEAGEARSRRESTMRSICSSIVLFAFRSEERRVGKECRSP